MKFCPSCDTPYQEGTMYCTQCGAELTQSATPSTTVQDVVYSQAKGGQRKVHCSNSRCRSTTLSPIVETSINTTTSGGGYSGTKGCLGYLLFGPCGLLCGSCGQSQTSTTNSTNRTYWVCQKCGNKFRNLQDLEDEIAKMNKMSTVLIVASVFLAVCVLLLWVVASKVSASGLAVFGAVFAIAIVGICGISHFPKLKKLKQEHEELLRNCFD